MSAGKKPRRRQNNRRDVLLEAAARQFLRHGYAAASMRHIASDAGLQPASIYYHFASKADLLSAVHEEGMRRITEAVTETIEGGGGPWVRLERACAAHLGVLLEGGDFFGAVMREVPDRSHPSRRSVTRMRDDYEAIFARLLDDLSLPPRTDRHNLRLMLMGAMNWSFTWYRQGAETPAHIAGKFVRALRQKLDRGGDV